MEYADGIRVGLIDLQGNISLLLKIGEAESGIQLISADLQAETVVVRRGGENIVLRLDNGALRTSDSATFTPIQKLADSRTSVTDPAAGVLQRRELALSRIQARRDSAMQARGEPSPDLFKKVTGPELERKLQEYQMEVIRQGLPPLPIPLSEKMDDQLVSVGVLPPQ